MKTKLFCILTLLLVTSAAFTQSSAELVQGEVTFVTSKNVYVKFDNTDNINVGDSLQISNNTEMVSCLSVRQKSSNSCVCIVLNECKLEKGDVVFFRYIPLVEEEKEELSLAELLEISEAANQNQGNVEEESVYKQRIKGRLSAATYSNLEDQESRHRMLYRFSLNATHINNSKFSAETYINYRQNFLPDTESNRGRQTKFFRVYNLAVRYDVDTTLTVLLGRKINNKASSLGAIDGFQGEKILGKNYIGLIAGFRPDIFDFGFNSSMFQYGAYIGRSMSNKKLFSQTTLGLLEQRNTGNIDRRYVYFQHSSTINRNLSLFGSLEFDIYSTYHEGTKNNPRLTNLYVSARYKFSRKLNVGVSYDSRKRIIYYETLRTEVERLLADDEARQGLRFRVNVKPIKYVNVGASYSRRFQSNQQNKSENINGFISLSKIPSVGGRLSLNYNMNTSNYLESKVIAIRHSRSLVKNKLNADFYLRMVNYHYIHSEVNTEISYYGTSFSYRINRKLRLSILGEMATRKSGDTYRVNFKITQRFDKK